MIMKIRRLIGGFSLVACLAALWPVSVPAQSVFNTPTTAGAQRTALNSVRSEVRWLQNSTRVAPSYREQGYGGMWRSFLELRRDFGALTMTLTAEQAAYGENDLSELNNGLDILEEAFTNYHIEVAAGRSSSVALANLSRSLRQGSNLWLAQLNKTSSRLRIGWG